MSFMKGAICSSSTSVFTIWLWNEKYIAFELTHIPCEWPHHVLPVCSCTAPCSVTIVDQLGTFQSVAKAETPAAAATAAEKILIIVFCLAAFT